MFKYSALQQTIVNLNIADPQILKRTSLQALNKVYEAYPVTMQDAKLCVLMPKGMAPRALAKLNEEAAVNSRIVVLMEEANTWKKVWPTEAEAKAAAAASTHAKAEPPKGLPDMELIIEEE